MPNAHWSNPIDLCSMDFLSENIQAGEKGLFHKYRIYSRIGRTVSLGLLKWNFAVDSQIGRTIIWGQTKPILDKIVKY